MSSVSSACGDAQPFGGASLGRRLAEFALALTAASALGLAVALMSELAIKYQVAAVVGLLLAGAVLLHPDRRIILVVLWVVVMPLGMEKVFDSGLSVGPEFETQFIVLNAADVLLMLLAGVLALDGLRTGRSPVVWTRFTTVWSVVIAWAFVSYAIHGFYLRDGLVNVAPLSLLTHLRTLAFFVLLQSSIRTRADLITVMIAIGCTLVFQSMVVMLSYVTGEVYNLSRLTGGPSIKLNTFGSGGESVTRATGTIGYTNQQAAYHAFCTMPLVALLALRNAAVRNAAIAAIGLSVTAVLLTFARGAWIAQALAAVQTLGVFAWRRMIPPAAWLKGALLTIVACIALSAIAYPVLQRLTKGGDDGATDSRLRMISLALDLFQRHPFLGVGPGEYVEAGYRLEPINLKAPEWVEIGGLPMVPSLGRLEVSTAVLPDGRSSTVPLPVHNRYLLSLTELGVPGLLLWLALFAAVMQAAWRCARADDAFYRYFGIAGGGAITGMVVYMLLDLFADDKSLQIAFLTPVLLCTAAHHVARAGRRLPPAAVPVATPAPGGLSGALLGH